MKFISRRLISIVAMSMAALVAMAGPFSMASPAAAQEPEVEPSLHVERPFRLPFLEPPGPATWLMAQPYGNTTGAYRQRFTTYGLSGGIHFGLDLSAPCGTELVAIADGIVFAVDGPFGSPPHNLMIDHPQLGYATMYGHLLEAPNLLPGEVVKEGQVVALSGDAGETCYSRPHLHLEIRDLDHAMKYNPALLVEANWDNLAMISSSGRDFARDLEEPRKWQTLYDQPQARRGGPIVNDFTYPWPFDWSQKTASDIIPVSLVISIQPAVPVARPEPLRYSAIGRQVTTGNCCTQFYWSRDSSQIRFIDQPGPEAALGFWGVEVVQPEAGPELVSERLGYYSPDGSLVAYPDRNKGVAVIERLADGATWEFDTQENGISFTPDGQHVTWTMADEDAPRDNREEARWMAGFDGSEARILYRARRVNAIAWLADDELLMARRIPGGDDQHLFILALGDGRETDLIDLPEIRGLALTDDRRYLVYYVTFESNPQENGVWLFDLQKPRLAPQKLPFFGTYRWRDNERLIYVPLDAAATEHNFFEYNIRTGLMRPLFPAGTGLVIANNEWHISPDGDQIALLAANGFELDGIWVLDLDEN